MSSEIEGALARKEDRHAGVHSPAPAFGHVPRQDSLESLVEVGRALSATIDLRQGLQGALEVLNRRPGIVRSAITLALPEVTDLVVDADREPASSDPGGHQHSFLCTTVLLDGRPIGALAVDLVPQRDDPRERIEALVQASAELIGQAVQIRQLFGEWARTEPMPVPPGASLAEMVSRYERGVIERALEATRGNRSRAAKLLRTTERIVGYRVQQYGIDCSLYRG